MRLPTSAFSSCSRFPPPQLAENAAWARLRTRSRDGLSVRVSARERFRLLISAIEPGPEPATEKPLILQVLDELGQTP